MERIKSVRFELSGYCELSELHKDFCPNSKISNAILSMDVIEKVILDLPANFKGNIGFHNHNNPTNDPRLYLLVQIIKNALSDSKIQIWSNGLFMNKDLIKEAFLIGVNEFIITAYSDDIYNYFKNVKGVSLYKPKWDNRLNIYARKPINCKIPCDAPFGQLLINRFGHIALCCQDWKYTMTFGDLNKQSLEECFPAMNEIYQNLIKGNRIYDICSRCKRTRIRSENTNL